MGTKENHNTILRFGDDWVWDSNDTSNPWRRIRKPKKAKLIIRCVRFIRSVLHCSLKKHN